MTVGRLPSVIHRNLHVCETRCYALLAAARDAGISPYAQDERTAGAEEPIKGQERRLVGLS